MNATTLSPGWLLPLVPQVAETGGDMQRYWQLWDKGEWWWHVGPKNITFGGHYRSKCSQ